MTNVMIFMSVTWYSASSLIQTPWYSSHTEVSGYVKLSGYVNNWASEASPTLGCSIEISRDIYIYIYIYMLSVCLVCQITWNHVNQTRACSKSVLGGKIRPVTPILFVSSIR